MDQTPRCKHSQRRATKGPYLSLDSMEASLGIGPGVHDCGWGTAPCIGPVSPPALLRQLMNICCWCAAIPKPSARGSRICCLQTGTVMVCDYLEDTVVRAGGFTNLENANAWAQYMTEVEGFQAFVARPAANSEPTTPTTTTPETNPSAPDNATATNSQPTTPTTTTPETNPSASDSATATNSQPGAEATPTEFTPQPLGEGFAVTGGLPVRSGNGPSASKTRLVRRWG